MKKLLLLILLSSCEMAGQGDDIDPERFGETSFTYYDNSRIKASAEFPSGLMAQYDIESGSKRVFEYIFVKEDNPMIADDEFSEAMVFEIPSTTKNATFKDNEIKDLNLTYRYVCYCLPVNGLKDIKGTLDVSEKSGGKFQVKADMELFFESPEGMENTTNSRQIAFDEVFVKN